MGNFDIMSVREIIDDCFGVADTNTVNFKLLHTILHILARQLKILNRHVSIGFVRRLEAQTKLKVTELKIHSKSKKKKGRKGEDSQDGKTSEKDKSPGKTAATKTTTDKSSAEEYSAEKSSKKKTATEKSVPTTETESDKKKRGGTKKGRYDESETSNEEDKDSGGILHEKLLIVSRKPSDASSAYSDDGQQGASARDAGASKRFGASARKSTRVDTDQLTVATQDQFYALLDDISELQGVLGLGTDLSTLIGSENLEALLHNRTSMAHPMAAINMSARLEAVENKLAKFMPIATKLAEEIPGIDLESEFDEKILKHENIKGKGPPGLSSKTPPPLSKSGAFKQPPRKSAGRLSQTSKATNFNNEDDLLDESEEELETADQNQVTGGTSSKDVKVVKVTYEELNTRMDELYDEVVKKVTEVTTRSSNISDLSHKKMMRLEEKLEAALNLGEKFNDLDLSVEDYSETVNYIDAKLSSKMSEYQDGLTQMQYDLEIGLDTLAEAMAAPSEDADAIAELNGRFTTLQVDINFTAERQRELKLLQGTCGTDLEDLKRQLKLLRDKKCSREEVFEALSDKAGIAALNGIVPLDQFDAVRGDFEKRIGLSYDAFNNKEVAWQKIIDDAIRIINDKSDTIQMVSLKEDIQKHLAKMMGDLDDLLAIVGQIEITTVTKKIERFDNCLSCGTRANIEVDDDNFDENLLSRPPVIGAESADTNEEGARKVCFPGRPVPHPIDPRAITCQRYCGAPVAKHESSFIVPTTKMKQPQDTLVGTDAKYLADEKYNKNPCAACTIKTLSP